MGPWLLAALLVPAIAWTDARADTPARAYPPSCFADGLPLGQGAQDPHLQGLSISLHGDFNACFVSTASPTYAVAQQECHYSEAVNVFVFRVPCSAGTSATLLEIDRAAGMQGHTDLYPTFPGVWVLQGAHIAYIRLSQDANTTTTQTFVNSPVYRNSIYTLENSAGQSAFDYNQSFTLTVDNNTGLALQFALDAYHPADYPAAALGMPLTGYLTGSWYDPAHSGEGILTQIFDNGDGAITRTFVATWYTFDATGVPFWLVAQGTFPIGATHVDNVAVQSVSGGGFAGAFNAVTRSAWGTMSFAFSDCSHVHFSYASGNGNAAGVPAGSGTRDWVRIGNIDALNCQ
ncbi:MAG: hypothetical protein ABI846_11820 [Rudaea sp.]